MRLTLNSLKLQELKELDEEGEVLKELIGLFIPSFESKHLGLVGALKNLNVGQIKAISHELRSSCANLGAEVLSDLATELQYLPEGDNYFEKANQLIIKMNEEFSSVKSQLINIG